MRHTGRDKILYYVNGNRDLKYKLKCRVFLWDTERYANPFELKPEKTLKKL